MTKGLFFAILSYVLWGILPLYWNALNPIDSFVIIFYRIVLVAAVCFLVLWKNEGLSAMRAAISGKKNVAIFLLAGAFITANWSLYVWAVKAGYIIQTSIGHYIEPLLISLFGIVIFKEKLTRWTLAAFLTAAAGVALSILLYQETPFLAVALGLTFAIYAAVKRYIHCSSLMSLFFETVFFVPPALIAVLYLECTGQGALAATVHPAQYALLLLAGFVTIGVLWLFSEAEKKTSLTNIGIIAYISPTISLLLGIFFYHEPFDERQLAAFLLIWTGMLIFMLGQGRERKKTKYTFG